jgi:hypothetical protein
MNTTTHDPLRLDLNTMIPFSLDYTSLKYPVLEATTTSPYFIFKNTITSNSSATFLIATSYSNLEQKTRSTFPIDDVHKSNDLEKSKTNFQKKASWTKIKA